MPQHVGIQPVSNTLQQPPQTSCNIQSPHGQLTCSLPPNLIEQIRSYMPSTSGPIFILPNNPIQQPQQTPQPVAPVSNCPGFNYHCNPSQHCCPPSYYPCPYSLQFINPFLMPQLSSTKESTNCSCCPKKSTTTASKKSTSNESNEQQNNQHMDTSEDDTTCNKKNCPASINLQALASQLLSIQGVISCAATRLILRKIPGSNILDKVDDIIERAKNTTNTLNQEQLITETRNSQQVNALINLHMTASPVASVIPILTTVQLKINLLKNHIDSLINRRLGECQGVGAEDGGLFDPLVLCLKSDEELRTFLTALRQKECNERVNYSFSPYNSQRVIAETRLRNIENKIKQIEKEMERRRAAIIPRGMRHNFCDNHSNNWHCYPGTIIGFDSFGGENILKSQTYESPDPFQIDFTNPRRLILKPHVGSPETTYKVDGQHKNVTFNQQKDDEFIQQNKIPTQVDDVSPDDPCTSGESNKNQTKSNDS